MTGGCQRMIPSQRHILCVALCSPDRCCLPHICLGDWGSRVQISALRPVFSCKFAQKLTEQVARASPVCKPFADLFVKSSEPWLNRARHSRLGLANEPAAATTLRDAATAHAAVVAAVADGDLTPGEAGELSAVERVGIGAVAWR